MDKQYKDRIQNHKMFDRNEIIPITPIYQVCFVGD